MKKSASRIDSVLQNILKQYQLEQKYENTYIIQFWQKIVPENINKICKPIDLKEGILTVKANTEAWKKEIKNNSKTLIKLINDKMGKNSIRAIEVI
ncbi:MAG TPA: DUF721 domain-containing protein [Caldithrix abyssi]|uniref:DUF721 domain-containing protein n=1 Tax=Caldithrix abyssi TaxID=187145 RepID=A0A7V4TXW9_CALAY|nr:DUF721 domain-containing protein [Caldithrix abyssi]